MEKETFKCSECDYCAGYRGGGAERMSFQCHHPDQKSIKKYFDEHKINKLLGFIGFGERWEKKPSIKSSPRWCPKRMLASNRKE